MKHLTRFLACALCLGMITACAQTNKQAADDTKSASDTHETKSSEEKSMASPKTAMRPESDRYKQAGFAVYQEDGRLWVFRSGSDNLKSFHEKGEPAKRVTLVGAGPDGMTVLGAERDVLEAYCAPYMYGVPGYVVIPEDGRLWVFLAGSDNLKSFHAKGEPAKRVTLIGVGPRGKTLLGADMDVVKAYRVAALYGKPGFVVIEEDGRLWVFQENSEAHAEFVAKGEPAKRVTLIGVGPEGKTLMGADRETLNAYLGGSNP